MQKLFTIFYLGILSSFALTIQAQSNYCGTELGEQQKARLIEYAKNGHKFQHKAGAKYYVPIFFHMVGDNDGKGFFGINQLMQDICQLNRQYVPVGFYFYPVGIEYISNTAYYDHDYSDGFAMMNQYNKPNAANVYVVQNPAGNCGYFSPGADGVAVGKNCMGNGATTLAHELGHFFSLPHPFDNVTGVKEYVNGTNCAAAGDLFCDTRADYLNVRWECPYNGTKLDPLGVPYNPDETLYMGYASDHCATRFSDQQIGALLNDINVYRPELKGPVQDTTPTTQRAVRVWPQANATTQPAATKFAWKSVNGAKWYILQVSSISVFPGNNLPVEIITADTAYTATTLANNKNYRWRVRPVFPGKTCTEFSDTGMFYTSTTAAIHDFETSEGMVLYPNPAKNNGLIYVALQTEEKSSFSATIYTLDGKTISTKPLAQQSVLLYTLDAGSLPAGVYMVDISNGVQVYRKKLMVE